MLRITTELLPFGGEEGRKTIDVFDIANEGNGSYELGNYMVRMAPDQEWVREAVINYPRLNTPVSKLIYLALHKIYGNKE